MTDQVMNQKMTDQEILKVYESERKECEVWTRCMCYFRPVSHFNIGKKSEFKERKWFQESKVCPCNEMKLAG